MKNGAHIVHVSPRVQARGGIETLHELHRRLPGRQVFVALFDRSPAPRENYVNLGISGRTPLFEMRRKFARALAPYAGSVVIYHNGWGLPFFHDLDGAGRRAVMLHADPAYHAPDFAGFAGRIDGSIAITPATQMAVGRALPAMAGERNAGFRVPIEFPPAGLAPRTGGRPVVLGWAGRIERAQKRLDRLPKFLAALRARQLDFRFEMIGEGSYRDKLAREVGHRVTFHGWVSREEYWRALARWDGMVFFSDHEGGPIALLEGMAAGAVPFYPAHGGSWANHHMPHVDARCHYPAGDLETLADSVAAVFREPESAVALLRSRAREAMTAHSAENYLRECQRFIEQLTELPRISTVRAQARKWSDLLPLGVVTRLWPRALQRD